MNKRNYITKEGQKELEKKIKQQQLLIEEISKEKAIAYEVSGDGWHDNPGFNQLVQKEEKAINDLLRLKERIANSFIIETHKRNTALVSIGSIVKYKMKYLKSGESKNLEFEIAGSGETDLTRNRISYDSPIGSALLGMKKGEIKVTSIPKGEVMVEVIDILSEWN